MTSHPHPPMDGDETITLRGCLDLHRAVLREKCQGLTSEQLAQTLPPSDMTLGGLLKHLAVVESGWFSEDFLGGPLIAPFDTVDWEADRDWEWHTAHQDTPEQLLGLYDAAVAESERITDEALATDAGLDTVAARDSHGQHPTLRWILVHMIEEYAQHNGHADLIRESIDGRTGF
ncbi:DinB family protein [Ornithinimicrobium cryptoxanthini]|uniref:DinB family protein n=1 Tax=Ornithinimicrobium cryptoxanthini TaxID=2934161 RepID=UPI002117C172|nr:DinB family protein [Ornithinimicrobium cryptoxanthini]